MGERRCRDILGEALRECWARRPWSRRMRLLRALKHQLAALEERDRLLDHGDESARQRWERTKHARWLAVQVLTLRFAHELTEREFAKRLGVELWRVHEWESGEGDYTEDEAEDTALLITLVVSGLLERSYSREYFTPIDDVIRDFGADELLDEPPPSDSGLD